MRGTGGIPIAVGESSRTTLHLTEDSRAILAREAQHVGSLSAAANEIIMASDTVSLTALLAVAAAMPGSVADLVSRTGLSRAQVLRAKAALRDRITADALADLARAAELVRGGA
jgi:hypothetical protein